MKKICVTIWNEYIHERNNPQVARIYPYGIHYTIARYLQKVTNIKVQTATLDQREHGLTKKIVTSTDVFIWWGHIAQDKVNDKIVVRVAEKILAGAGLIVLHSAQGAKLFRRLMGTSCNIQSWRETGEREYIWTIDHQHPISDGIEHPLIIPQEEMYSERFDVPEPEKTIFISTFKQGEIFRSGLIYTRGLGKIFYFRPGHETFPTYHQPQVLQIILNTIRWMNPF